MDEDIAVKGIVDLKQFKLSPFVLAAAIVFLALGELLAGTSLYFVAIMAATMLCIGITYNTLGGLGTIGGIAFSVFALSTFVISQFAKVIFFESAIKNLESPQLTITVYLLFYFSLMLGAFVFGRLRLGLPKPLEPTSDKQRNLMYVVAVVIGTVAAANTYLGGFGGIRLSRAFEPSYLGLLLFSIVLAVQHRIQKTNGLHSIDIKVLIPWIFLIGYGYLSTTRQFVLLCFLTYLLTCHFSGFGLKRKHIIAAVAGVIAFVTIISPFFIFARGIARGGVPDVWQKSEEMFHLLTTPNDWKTVMAATTEAEGGGGRANYYSRPGTFVLNRFSLIRLDSNLISACSGGYHYGFEGLKNDFLMLIPRFLYNGKPVLNSSELTGHVTGMTSDEMDNNYSVVTAIGDSYGGFGLLGVALVGLFVFPGLFIIFESMFDIGQPWGIVALGSLCARFQGPLLGSVITLAVRLPLELLITSYLIGILARVTPTRGSR